MKVVIHPTKLETSRVAAADGAQLIRAALADRSEANIMVASGASQLDMLGALVKAPGIAWDKVTAFHLDEYIGMPITHTGSIRRYLWERFSRQLPVPLEAFYLLEPEGNPEASCRQVGRILARNPIDVAFIGIGENGHLAFNDPPADFKTERPYIIVKLDEPCRRQQFGEGWFERFEDVPGTAISASIRQIMKSAAIVCTAPEARKARAVKSAVEGAVTEQVPASILQKHANCTIYLDQESASLLSQRAT